MSDLSILTKKKKVVFEEENGEKKEVVLYPFGFQYFNDAIKIINRYYSCYTSVKEEYNNDVQFILGNTDYDEETKKIKLDYLSQTFDEIGGIVRNVLSSEESSLGKDISDIITFCCRKELNFNDFHWGEVGVLLAAAIEVNMDFFVQNKSKITLLKEVEEKPQIEGTVTSGESK